MTDQITVPRATWDAMREALEEYLNKDNVELQLNGIKSKAIEALTAANAVSAEARCQYCDGTGDVHTPTGEWRGSCDCEAANPQATEPAGYKLVPVEPTPEMLSNFYEAHRKWINEEGDDAVIYRAMLAAAPEAKQ